MEILRWSPVTQRRKPELLRIYRLELKKPNRACSEASKWATWYKSKHYTWYKSFLAHDFVFCPLSDTVYKPLCLNATWDFCSEMMRVKHLAGREECGGGPHWPDNTLKAVPGVFQEAALGPILEPFPLSGVGLKVDPCVAATTPPLREPGESLTNAASKWITGCFDRLRHLTGE